MKIRLLQIAVAMLMLMLSINVFAQEGADDPLGAADRTTRYFLGPVFGYNSIDHKAAKLATFAGDAYCPYFEGGTGQGFYAGLSYEYHIGKAESSISSVIGRVLYSMYPGTMDAPGDEFPTLVDDPSKPSGLTIVRSSTKHTVEINYSVVAIEVMYKQNFIKEIPLGLTAGPTIEIPIANTVTQEYHLVKPDDVQFTEVAGYNYSADKRTVTVKDGDIDNASGVRIGIKFGIQYEIIPFDRMYIVPALYYNYSLTSVKSDEDWSMNIFQAGDRKSVV